jgi:hypothetical protein
VLTLEQTAMVTPDRRITIDVPQAVMPGEHRITVVIDTETTSGLRAGSRQLDIIPLHLNAPTQFTYRREDLYGDDGR